MIQFVNCDKVADNLLRNMNGKTFPMEDPSKTNYIIEQAAGGPVWKEVTPLSNAYAVRFPWVELGISQTTRVHTMHTVGDSSDPNRVLVASDFGTWDATGGRFTFNRVVNAQISYVGALAAYMFNSTGQPGNHLKWKAYLKVKNQGNLVVPWVSGSTNYVAATDGQYIDTNASFSVSFLRFQPGDFVELWYFVEPIKTQSPIAFSETKIILGVGPGGHNPNDPEIPAGTNGFNMFEIQELR